MDPTTTQTIDDERLDEAYIRLRTAGGRADVVLDNPQARNAQTASTWRALAAVPRLLPDEVRVVVLSAVGPSFSAGLDRRLLDGTGVPGSLALADMARLGSDEISSLISEYQQAFTWWRESDLVTVAAVQGHAVGAGFQLALATDIMVVADDARLAMRETSLGLVPDLGGTGPLVEAVGYGRALEICATGRWVGADEAVASRLATVAVPGDQLAATVDDLVSAMLAAPPGSLRATKRLLVGARSRSRHEQLAAERAEQIPRLRELASLLG